MKDKIGYVGLIPTVIILKLFLDIVLSSLGVRHHWCCVDAFMEYKNACRSVWALYVTITRNIIGYFLNFL